MTHQCARLGGLSGCLGGIWGAVPPCSQKPTPVCHFLGAYPGGPKGHPPGPHPFRPQGFQISHHQHQIPDPLYSTATFHACLDGGTPQTILKNSGENGGAWGECGEQFPPRVGLHLGTVCSTPTYNGGLWQVELTMAVKKHICLDGGLGGSKTSNFA